MNPTAISLIDPNGLYQQMDIARITGYNYSTVYRWITPGKDKDGKTVPPKLRSSVRKGNGRPIVKGRDLISFLSPKY